MVLSGAESTRLVKSSICLWC